MAVRRLHPEQPPHFSFSAENAAWADAQIAKYPPGKQASAIIPMLWRAQEQNGGWLTEPAIRAVCDKLGMAYIRGLEIATFYTMFQLSPVGRKAHVQVCGTTPCMLNGARALVDVCKRRIAEHQHELSPDGSLSWEEVECLGNCANAPMVQIDKDTFEDLTPALLEAVIDGFVLGNPPKPGSQIGRTASCPAGGPTTLQDPSLYDGSTIGAWKKRFDDMAAEAAAAAVEKTPPSALASPAHKAAVEAGVSPSSPGGAGSGGPATAAPINPAALAAMANAGLVKELQARGDGKPLPPGELDRLKIDAAKSHPGFGVSTSAPAMPELLKEPRNGEPDELGLIWGVGDKLADQLNAMGIWHFDQIARWTPAHIAWFEAEMDGFKGRVVRDKWVEQCEKLATGWRPDSDVGERPKE
jgi:NADH-quinone oxidoreductase subunit E